MKKTDIFENDNMNVLASVTLPSGTNPSDDIVIPVLGILNNAVYVRCMNNDGTDFTVKGFGIPKNVNNNIAYATMLGHYWFIATLQGQKKRLNTLASKKAVDRTTKDETAMNTLKISVIPFTEDIIAQNNISDDSDIYPTAIRTTVWAVNKGAWSSADGATRYWPLGGKGLADDIVSYATGKMSKADFKKQYCAYTAQWLKTSENGDDIFGDLFRNFSPKATDLMVSDLVNCYKGVKVDYNEKGINHKGIRGQALVAQAVLQMLKTVYKFEEKDSKKTVTDATI